MSTAGEPVPQRIGDAERDRAVELLREHMAEGRLDAVEFEERLTSALAAKTAGDLHPLFLDLPGPRPGQELAATAPDAPPPWQAPPAAATAVAPIISPHGLGFNSWAGIISAAVWTAAVMVIHLGPGWNFWWLLFIPMIVSSALGKERQDRDRQRLAQQERAERLEKERRKGLTEK